MSRKTINIADGIIAFHRPFVELEGANGRLGVTGALMLSQAVYWARRTDDPDGWFWKTAEEWEEETGLSYEEQRTARKRLRGFPWWHEERRGVPAKMYYRVDVYGLYDWLGWTPRSQIEGFPKSSSGKSPEQEAGNPQNINKNTEITTKTITTGAGAAAPPKPQPSANTPQQPETNEPNPFRVYEENIGALTPILAERIEELVAEHGAHWFRAAVAEAVSAGVRRLRYVEAILERWKRDGYGSERPGRAGKRKTTKKPRPGGGQQAGRGKIYQPTPEEVKRNPMWVWDEKRGLWMIDPQRAQAAAKSRNGGRDARPQ